MLATAPIDRPHKTKYCCSNLFLSPYITMLISSDSLTPKVTKSPYEFPYPLKSNRHKFICIINKGYTRQVAYSRDP